MSAQILLNPIGSAGDVFPFLALGRELQKRGYHVGVMTNQLFQENVGHAGLEFIEVGTRDSLRAAGIDSRIQRPGNAWKLALSWGAVGTMRQTFDIIQQRMEKCRTMLVAPSIGFGARIAAEKFNLPLATIALSPFVIRSACKSPKIPPLLLNDRVPKIAKRLQFWLADRLVVDRIVRSDVAGFRQELGLGYRSRFLHRWCFSDDVVLALFPDLFAPQQPDWPTGTHLVGHVSWDPPTDPRLVRDLNAFINPEKKPIAILAGSAGPESLSFYSNWIEAARIVDRQLILLERNQNAVPGQLPEHVFHARYFPVDQVLAHTAMLAHSGGIGATLRTLAAGVPQVVFPRVNDQPDNADRVRKLGIGRTTHRKRSGAQQIANVIKDVLNDRAILANCKSCRKAMVNVDSVQSACDLIELTFDKNKSKV